MSSETSMRRSTTQIACLATAACAILASFRAESNGLSSGSEATTQPVTDDSQAEEQGDGHHGDVTNPEQRHLRAPINVPLYVTEEAWLRAPGDEWYAKQKESGSERYTHDETLADGDGGWIDSEGEYYLRYDEVEEVWAYWTWAGPAQLTRGRQDFLQFCSSCHGIDGDGYGRSGQWLRPSPRSFLQSNFKFTKVIQPLPTDAAMMRLIKRGLEGTPMLPWALSDEQLTDIIQYIKSLSPEMEGWRDPFTGVGDIVESGTDPWIGQESLGAARGKKLYHDPAGANCALCHPGYVSPSDLPGLIDDPTVKARENYYLPVLKDSAYTVLDYTVKIMPPDFTWHQLRAGTTTQDLFETIASGIKGTAMPQWKGALPDEDIWALAHYIDGLIKDYKGKPAGRAEFMKGLRPTK